MIFKKIVFFVFSFFSFISLLPFSFASAKDIAGRSIKQMSSMRLIKTFRALSVPKKIILGTLGSYLAITVPHGIYKTMHWQDSKKKIHACLMFFEDIVFLPFSEKVSDWDMTRNADSGRMYANPVFGVIGALLKKCFPGKFKNPNCKLRNLYSSARNCNFRSAFGIESEGILDEDQKQFLEVLNKQLEKGLV
jgi:hypothetical protein